MSQLHGSPAANTAPTAFRSCVSLADITVPDCLTAAPTAFRRCVSLADITVPDCLTAAPTAFRSCLSLSGHYGPRLPHRSPNCIPQLP